MAKYKAEPNYAVKVGKGYVQFDHNGEYETSKQDELKVLDGIDKAFVEKVEAEKATPKAEEKKEAPTKRVTARKSSAK